MTRSDIKFYLFSFVSSTFLDGFTLVADELGFDSEKRQFAWNVKPYFLKQEGHDGPVSLT